MVRSGRFVAQFVRPCTGRQIQPNGVDLSVGEVFTLHGRHGAVLPDHTVLAHREPVLLDQQPVLQPGAYVIRYREQVSIPDGHVGVVYPRSSLLRNGAVLYSALWDQGYEGRGESLLVVWHPLALPPATRIGQLVLMTADSSDHYSGQWQRENL